MGVHTSHRRNGGRRDRAGTRFSDGGRFTRRRISTRWTWRRGRRTIVGVNKYRTEDPPDGSSLKVDEEAARRQTARLERVRRERDGTAASAALARSGGSGAYRRQHGGGHPGVRRKLLHPGRDMRRLPWGFRRAAGDGRAVGVVSTGSKPMNELIYYSSYSLGGSAASKARFNAGNQKGRLNFRRRQRPV